MINIGLVRLLSPKWPKVSCGAAKSEIKKKINYKFEQHPRSFFSWHPDIYQLLVHTNHLLLFLLKGFFNSVLEKVVRNIIHKLICNINLTVHKKVHVAYGSWSSWKNESRFCFDIESSRFFSRVAVNMISKRYVKMSTINCIP